MARRKEEEPTKMRTVGVRINKAHFRLLSLLYRIEGEPGQERIRRIIKAQIEADWARYTAEGKPPFASIALMSDEQFERLLLSIEEPEVEMPKRRRMSRPQLAA